jgi:hypothetical protein
MEGQHRWFLLGLFAFLVQAPICEPVSPLLPLPFCFPHQGWIPRTGLQYGADFVLYQRHPALAHSDYTVLVVPLGSSQRPAPSWHDLQIANRLSAQVSKKLLLLYVLEQGGDRASLSSLSRVMVHERLVRRWVPESHRPLQPTICGQSK